MSKTVLITGATKGIGYHLAQLFAKDGFNLVLVARHEEELKKLQQEIESSFNCSVQYICVDLSLPYSADIIYQRLIDTPIDVLVNNAGFGLFGPFETTEWSVEEQMIQCNLTTPIHLIKLFLPKMIERNSGYILNVASIASFVCGPYLSVYYATKAALLSFTESLIEECRTTNIRISVLCPGPTNTHFEQRALLEDSSLFERVSASSPEVVAKSGYRGLFRNKSVIIVGHRNQLLVALSRVAPRSLIRRVMGVIQSKRH